MSDTSDAGQQRFDRGMGVLESILGESGRGIIDRLADISPELARQIVAWAFGEVYPRPALALRDRQLVTLAVLTTLGGTETELEVHLQGALTVGLRPEEIVEALLHAAIYCGMPRAINATLVAKKVFGERGLLPVAAGDGTAGGS
ncbi:carboxymuconolactone decarboxylase family protein [Rugosimonospora acidiphila]|uniref:Carboxymuconolactone decarboxylase family protein n=1 Tax=Rugosimonospora acidiphila TaxID=556531 RepID=A0ABP9SUH6_9ACTN